MSYATVAQLREYLSQVPAGASADALLQSCLDRADDIVNAALGEALDDPAFTFAAWAGSPSTAIVKGYPTLYLTLPPVKASSATLVEEESSSSPLVYTTVADTWQQEAQQLYRPGGWASARYRVTAIWGYGPAPASVVELALELAVSIYRARDKGGFTEIVGVEGSGGLRHVAGLNAQQRQIVETVAARHWRASV